MKRISEPKNPEELLEMVRDNISFFTDGQLLALTEFADNEISKRIDTHLKGVGDDILEAKILLAQIKED